MIRNKVLITEDEGVIAMDLQFKLEKLGYEVTGVADSYDTAIAQVESAPPDIALMDINIVGQIDGVDTAKIIQEKYKIPVVFLTAFSDADTLSRAKKIAPFGYILKPVSEQNLHSVLEMALYKHETEKEVLRLSSFAKENPNPIVEVDFNNNVTYANPKVLEVFPDIVERGIEHPALTEVQKIVEDPSKKTSEQWVLNREISGDLYVFQQKICYHPNERVYRIYFNDISKLHATEIQLSRKNAKLLQKNKNITDSINYAQNIQEAIIPSVKDVQEIFHNLFIFYKPKDIVSGDFYWSYKSGTKSIIAVVDCTGHGVPGALMSMLGVNLLNRIVKQEGIYEPHKILAKLNDYITEMLNNKKSKSKAKDGMDISLCMLDNETNKLVYSGAYRPLYFIRDNELEVYQGNVSSIGGHDYVDKTFISVEIDTRKNDCFYIFSDGYADQFGGENGKKFTSKRLKSILIEASSKNINQQEKIIVTSFENWKGDLEQIDDVCIIGVKI